MINYAEFFLLGEIVGLHFGLVVHNDLNIRRERGDLILLFTQTTLRIGQSGLLTSGLISNRIRIGQVRERGRSGRVRTLQLTGRCFLRLDLVGQRRAGPQRFQGDLKRLLLGKQAFISVSYIFK